MDGWFVSKISEMNRLLRGYHDTFVIHRASFRTLLTRSHAFHMEQELLHYSQGLTALCAELMERLNSSQLHYLEKKLNELFALVTYCSQVP